VAIQFDCPWCTESISVEESKASARIDCPHCNRPVKVPAKPTHEPPSSLPESSLTSSADTPASRLDSAVSEPPLPPASPPQPAQIPLKRRAIRERKIVVVLSFCLILDFVWQFFSSPDQRPFETAPFAQNAFWITQVILMIVVMVGLVGLTIRILKVNGAGAWLALVILGFIAGTGGLLIKVSAQLDNEQRMRSADLGIALSHYDSRSVYLKSERWMQVCSGATSGYEHITPQDLRLFDSMSRDTLGTIDEVLQQLPASSQEPWRVRRALISACSEQAKLFTANWDEWHVSGVKPPQGEAEPWQKEAMRLQGEIDALRKQDKQLSPKVDEAYERFKSDSR
jgi:hypothetical protein